MIPERGLVEYYGGPWVGRRISDPIKRFSSGFGCWRRQGPRGRAGQPGRDRSCYPYR
jgi:hypothetical protein